MTTDMLDRAARSLQSLAPAMIAIEADGDHLAARDRAIERGWFNPDEDEAVRTWFAMYLTARGGLLEIIDDLRPIAFADPDEVDERSQLGAFVIGYAAACLLVRGGRHLLNGFATDSLVQRKLNEAEPRFRIRRKQYTSIYRSLTSPRHALQIAYARGFAAARRDDIDGLADDPVLGAVVRRLRASEDALGVEAVDYAKARLRYRWHWARRNRASAMQQCLFGLFLAFGHVIAEMRPWWHRDRVRPVIQRRLEDLLEPGDVIITRHDRALSNLLLPGYWPHAALHLGVDASSTPRWTDPARVLEARKDGVLFRPLDDTFAVDCVTVIRPRLTMPLIGEAIDRAVEHEGKLYDFEFDFFRSDRLVCTEVVYRAYDGVGDLALPLTRRAGRPTLSAEDLITLALDGKAFTPVAVFGTPRCRRRLVTGPRVERVLRWLKQRFAEGVS
jgi:hypothetical protein